MYIVLILVFPSKSCSHVERYFKLLHTQNLMYTWQIREGWKIYPQTKTFFKIVTLPETNIAPENGWLEYDRFLLGPGLFSGANC